MYKVERQADEANTDLMPLGWLWRRGCRYEWDDHGASLRTPHGTRVEVNMWGDLPYVSATGLKAIFKDLPNRDALGRGGRPADSIVPSARVAITLNTKAIRDQLSHISAAMSRKELANIVAQYRALPEHYYEGRPPSRPRTAQQACGGSTWPRALCARRRCPMGALQW